MSYLDGKAVARAPIYFEGPVEELCLLIWSFLLDEIGLESARH